MYNTKNPNFIPVAMAELDGVIIVVSKGIIKKIKGSDEHDYQFCEPLQCFKVLLSSDANSLVYIKTDGEVHRLNIENFEDKSYFKDLKEYLPIIDVTLSASNSFLASMNQKSGAVLWGFEENAATARGGYFTPISVSMKMNEMNGMNGMRVFVYHHFERKAFLQRFVSKGALPDLVAGFDGEQQKRFLTKNDDVSRKLESKEHDILVLSHAQKILCMAISLDKQYLAVCSADKISLLLVDNVRCFLELPGEKDACCIAFSSNNRQLLIATRNGVARRDLFGFYMLSMPKLLDGRNWEDKNELQITQHSSKLRGVAFAGEDRVVSCDKEGVVKLWNYKTGACIKSFSTNYRDASVLGVSDDNKYLYLSALSAQAFRINLARQYPERLDVNVNDEEIFWDSHINGANIVLTRKAFRLSVRTILLGGELQPECNYSVDIEKYFKRRKQCGFGTSICIAYNKTHDLFFGLASSGTLFVFNRNTDAELFTFKDHSVFRSSPHRLLKAKDSILFAYAQCEVYEEVVPHQIQIFTIQKSHDCNVTTFKKEQPIEYPQDRLGAILSMEFSAAHQILAIGHEKSVLHFIDIKTRNKRTENLSSPVQKILCPNGGDNFVVYCESGEVVVYQCRQLDTLTCIRKFMIYEEYFAFLDVYAEGQLLSVLKSGCVRVHGQDLKVKRSYSLPGVILDVSFDAVKSTLVALIDSQSSIDLYELNILTEQQRLCLKTRVKKSTLLRHHFSESSCYSALTTDKELLINSLESHMGQSLAMNRHNKLLTILNDGNTWISYSTYQAESTQQAEATVFLTKFFRNDIKGEPQLLTETLPGQIGVSVIGSKQDAIFFDFTYFNAQAKKCHTVKMLSLNPVGLIELCQHDFPITCITLSRDQKLLASSSMGAVFISNLSNNTLFRINLLSQKKVEALRFSENKRQLFFLSDGAIFGHEIDSEIIGEG